ncbi:hypothetical protein AX17_003966 [Amanita inopinata Kibby_2008]|nr:hypothetical protein AX17_003966 [Amanita inopinata Kibby_2008]
MSLPLPNKVPSRYLRRRITAVALLFLAAISLFVLFMQDAFFSAPTSASRSKSMLKGNVEQALETLRAHQHKPHHPGHRSQVQLDTAQELAAVSSFLASLPQNVIPSFVDPSLPIDPQLILDFDTRGPRANQEVQAMVHDVWSRNPVFLYSKVYSSVSREVKSLLAGMHLRPAPTIIDVDIRDDVDVLIPLISRLTGNAELPVLIVGGKLLGSLPEIRVLERNGELRNLIAAAGAVIDGAKRKKHTRH